MIDVKTLERFASIMVGGITTESFPVIMAEVYQKVSSNRALSYDGIRTNCIEVLNYIMDNTNIDRNDRELNMIARQLIPGLVDAFMMIEHSRKRRFFRCL